MRFRTTGRIWARDLGVYGQIAARLPKRLDNLLDQAQRQRLTIVTKPSPESRQEQRELRNTISRLTWIVAAAFLLLSGVLWRMGDQVAASLSGTESPTDAVDAKLVADGGVVSCLPVEPAPFSIGARHSLFHEALFPYSRNVIFPHVANFGPCTFLIWVCWRMAPASQTKLVEHLEALREEH